MSVDKLGTTLSRDDQYHRPEVDVWNSICEQVDKKFPDKKNLVINMTWFGPHFKDSDWYDLLEYKEKNITYDNLFFLATVDPPYLNVAELQEVKNLVSALTVYYIGNFDSPHQFNFFAPLLYENFKEYTEDELKFAPKNVYMTLNRKPKPHRVKLVKSIIKNRLDNCGIITLGKDETNDLYLTLNTNDPEPDLGDFGMSMVYYNLGPLDLWQDTFLYINGATEFNPINDLFCQQDTFKPLIGMRPYVINGVQKTYRWLRNNGFKTFNHYWEHIDIENGDVTETIVNLIRYLSKKDKKEIFDMYSEMYDDLVYNRNRFFEFAKEQKNKMENIFE